MSEQITEVQLFQRLVQLETEKLTLADDVKQIKQDSTYDEDMNPDGFSKETVKLVAKAAILEARNKYEEQKEAADAVFAKYVELTGYND